MAELNQVLAAINAQLQHVAALSTAAEELQSRLAELSGTGFSAHREVTVQVDHHGIVTDLSFTPEAMELGPDGLSTAVLSAVTAASADLSAQAEPLRAQIMPTGPSVPFDPTPGERLDALYDQTAGHHEEGGQR